MRPSALSPAWEDFLARYPDAHVLQSSAWGELKSSFGWTTATVLEERAGALVLFRRLLPGMNLAYIPKGPVGDWMPKLLPAIVRLCRQRGCFALKVEPDTPDDSPPADWLAAHGFFRSAHTIQPRRTLVVDLSPAEEVILARMHQKTRYNIRLAERKQIRVHTWQDLQAFGEMMQQTAARDQFGAHTPEYYARAHRLFHPKGNCELFVAEHEGRPLAALMAFARGSRAWYLYGASLEVERQRMPTYLLQWEAMRWARSRGCFSYDLWGVPDAEADDLEGSFSTRHDGLWGVYRFKRGFGGRLTRSLGAWDLPLNRPLYAFYRAVVSRRPPE